MNPARRNFRFMQACSSCYEDTDNRVNIRTISSGASAQTRRPIRASEVCEANQSTRLLHGGRRLKIAVPVLLCFSLALMAPAMQPGPRGTNGASDNAAWELARSNPRELMRQISKKEIENSYGYRAPLRYRVRKITSKSDTTKEIVETSNGAVARLIAIDGKPLTRSQEQKEIERLRTVYTNPSLEKHRRRKEKEDADRVRKFTRMLPDAFLYQAANPVETSDGRLIRLTFAPNPKFTPPDFESGILTGIQGELWVDPEALRVVHIDGHIFRKVDFGWGILGTLYPGGTMLLEQTKDPALGWQLSRLIIHQDGKALLFKSIDIDVTETATNYHPVPRNWTYKDAVLWLMNTNLLSDEDASLH